METKSINLPSGKVAVIRAFTTRGDDRQASEVLNRGVVAKQVGDGTSIEFSLEAMQASQAKYVELLTVTIDDEPCNLALLDALTSADYDTLDRAVSEVTTNLDPKAGSKSLKTNS